MSVQYLRDFKRVAHPAQANQTRESASQGIAKIRSSPSVDVGNTLQPEAHLFNFATLFAYFSKSWIAISILGV
jgi:hypothetical protein